MATSVRDCSFCDIASGNDPETRVVCQGELTMAFLPTEPAVLGHTMLIPRRHVQDIWGLDSELARVLGAATVRLANVVRRAIQPEGMTIIQSNGPAASQSVMHLHIHIVPRWEGDSIGRIWPPETSFTENQKESAWDEIRRECRALETTPSSTQQ